MMTLVQTLDGVADALHLDLAATTDDDGPQAVEQAREALIARAQTAGRLLDMINAKLGLGDDGVFAEGWERRIGEALDAVVSIASQRAAQDDALAAELAQTRQLYNELDVEFRQVRVQRDEARSQAFAAVRAEQARDPVALFRMLMPAGAPPSQAGDQWVRYATQTACARAALDWWDTAERAAREAQQRGPQGAAPQDGG